MKRLHHETGMQLIALLAIVFAAVQWGGRDVRFGVAILFVALIAFLAGRRERRRPRPPAPDCEHCNDTGLTPGADHGTLITLPAPCTHCHRGTEAATRLRDALKEMGGLPPAGRSEKKVLLDAIRSERRQAECVPVDGGTAAFCRRMEEFVGAVL
jgi:hypothetical protein